MSYFTQLLSNLQGAELHRLHKCNQQIYQLKSEVLLHHQARILIKEKATLSHSDFRAGHFLQCFQLKMFRNKKQLPISVGQERY